MKLFLTALFTLLYLSISYSQQVYTDISPDGEHKTTYEHSPGRAEILNYQDVPYGSAPDWNAMRERQIGGMSFGDYDNDGDLDLAVGCYYSQSYPPINDYENMIFRNDNGVLDTLPAWISADERTTMDVRWADVNMDGKADLFSVNGQFQHSTLYLNSDSGVSTIPAWISNEPNVWTVGAAFNDVDGDGYLDLVMGNQGVDPLPYKPIYGFHNNSGVLSTTPTWTSGDEMITNSIAFADINNSDLTQHSVTYIASGSRYSFLIPMTPVYSIDAVSVNGAAVYNYTYDPLNSWISIGNTPPAGAQVDITFTYIKQGDFAAAKWVYFESGIYFNNNGSLNTLPGWTVGNTESQKGAGWADIDLDGYMDLAIGGSGIPTYIYKNNSGVLSATPYWSSNSPSTSVQDLNWADVNKDGYPDLTVVHFGNKRVEIFINRGGILDSTPTWTYITSTSATSIAFGDVNGDGWSDLAVGTARQPVMLFIADPSLIPVELNSFTASFSDNKVNLNWSTSTELNNKGFQIERKLNGGIWSVIDFVPGKGTTTETQSYSYTDAPKENGKYSYRLKQIDNDGTFSYSGVEVLDVIMNFGLRLDQNYPNPFNPETHIRFEVPQSSNGTFITLRINDVLGREIAVLVNEEKQAGEYEITFRPGDYSLSSGIYFYSLISGDVHITQKLIYTK